jgi:hypothetical protein
MSCIRKFYQPEWMKTRGYLVDIIDSTPDADGMIQVRRVADDEKTWVYPESLSEVPCG